MKVILECTEGYGFAVVAEMDFGHTSQVFTLSVGRWWTTDADRERFEIVEPAAV